MTGPPELKEWIALAESVQQIEIEAPIEAVWAEVTKVGSVQRAMLTTVLDTTFEVGAPVRYTSRDGGRTFVVGRVVEVKEPTLFAHTYRLTTADDPTTLVTWSLEELAPGRVRITLRHSGWPEEGKRMDQHGATWRTILSDLKRLLEGGDLSAKTKAQYALMRAFTWAMPAKTRTENVLVDD